MIRDGDQKIGDHFYFAVYPDPFDNDSADVQLHMDTKQGKVDTKGKGPLFYIKFGDEKGYKERPDSYGKEYWIREIMIVTGVADSHQIGKQMENHLLHKLEQQKDRPEFHLLWGKEERDNLRKYCKFLREEAPATAAKKIELKHNLAFFPTIEDFTIVFEQSLKD